MLYQGQTLYCQWRSQGIAELVLARSDHSVNKFDRKTLVELEQAISALEQAKPQGLLLRSDKDSFVVGADITEFLALFEQSSEALQQWLKQCNAIFNRLEDLPCPSVCAINGVALGGGLEVTLACDFRVASETARLGLPEVKLGIMPGFGGTVRLPRLLGADLALEWIATGQEQTAAKSLQVGLVETVVKSELLLDAADDLLKQAIEGRIAWKPRRADKKAPLKLNAVESIMAFSTAKALVAAKAGPHYPSPVKVVDTVAKAASMESDAALIVEAEAFVSVAKTPVARSLITTFLSDQWLKKQTKKQAAAARPVKQAAVLGAGIMGGGIAYQSASKGQPIIVKDIKAEALASAQQEAGKWLLKSLERGQISADRMLKTLASMQWTLQDQPLSQADFIVEAVVENAEVKKKVLRYVEEGIADSAILTSNTSTISIAELAGSLKRPENFCGLHFFNPVPRMPLVEVIRGPKTSDTTLATAVSYAATLGKTPVVINDCPGFFVNRVLFPYFYGFQLLLRDGVDFEVIDHVMEKFGWPMGPAYLLDVIGLDTSHHAAVVLAQGYPARMPLLPESVVTALYQKGHLGQKSGSGFYQYQTDKKGKVQKKRAAEVATYLPKQSVSLSEDAIVARMMLPMLFEVVRCLEEKIISTPMEADLALLYGLGFPPFRGGALQYLDQQGLANVCEQAKAYKALGSCYEPPALLQTMAAKQQSFYPRGVA